MGTFGLAAAIVNMTIGGGIFRLPANVAGMLGAAAPVAYLVCAVAMGLIVLCIADAGSRVSLTGGPYAYVGTAFGSYAGFISGLLLWMLSTFACAAVATVFAASFGQLVPALGTPTMHLVILVAVFVFWTLVNLRGAGLAARLNTAATIAKLLPLLLLAVAGLFFIDTDKLAWAAVPAASDVARTSLLLIFAFAGIEGALAPSGEVRDPARTVPRAIALAMIGVTALYLVLQVVAQGILGPGLAQSTVSPLADAANAAIGGWARTLLLAGASVSMFGYLGASTFSTPRVIYAFARDGFLPRRLASVHPAYHAPSAAIITQSAIALALALSGTFERLALLANVSALALYLGCALASWKLRADNVTIDGKAPFRMPFGRVLPWITCLVIAWLLTGLARQEWIAFGVCVAIGSLAYLARSKR
ncbi:MAG TPA: amino acid permease [Vicinamibacterales bacterium]|nr:amino acid permease [Vicinamibacterales bacterium]